MTLLDSRETDYKEVPVFPGEQVDTGEGRKILVIDDSEESRTIVRSSLQGLGSITEASDLREARSATDTSSYDMILLDLSLPDGDGIEFFAELMENEKTHGNPVIFVSAADEVQRKVQGFMLGGSDYIVKPFNPDELRARVKAQLRKRESEMVPKELQVGNIWLNLEARRAFLATPLENREIAVSVYEFCLLECLLRNPGRILFLDQVLSRLREFTGREFSKVEVSDAIESLNFKLLSSSHKIETVFEIGYRLVPRYRLSS